MSSEDHGERMGSRWLDKHLRVILLEEKESNIGSGMTLFKDGACKQDKIGRRGLKLFEDG